VILLRYLMREVLTTTAAVSFSLLLIVISARLVKFLAMAAKGQIAGDVLFWMVVYRLPSFLELILPLGMFIGILLAYGRLYVDSEMTILSACGVSSKKLALFTLASSLIISLSVGLISLYLAPVSLNKASLIAADKRNSEGINTIVEGSFKLYGDGSRVSYTRSLNDDRSEMQDVFIATRIPEKNREGQVQLVVADQGGIRVDQTNDVRYLELKNGFQYTITPGWKDVEQTRFATMGRIIDDSDRDLDERSDIDTTSTFDLWQRNDSEAQAALQWRISLPIMVLIMSLLALVMSRTNHRKGRYSKMLPAILLYLSYLIIMSTVRSAIESEKLSADIGLWPVHLLFLSIAIFLSNWPVISMKLKRVRA
jgi:lipopolysaccharide export system permease protein